MSFVYYVMFTGYQIPVLGYTLHYIINQNSGIIKPGDLTSCLNALVQVS